MTVEHFITPANRLAGASVGRGHFPHMGPSDVRVWRAALEVGLVEFDRLDYDVRLAGAGSAGVPATHEHKAMWDTLLRKRVDVVGWRGEQPTIIEVKPVAGFSALGQCLGYGWLWAKEKGAGVKPRLMIVCAFVDPDLSEVFAAYGIAVVVLPAEVAAQVMAQGSKGQVR